MLYNSSFAVKTREAEVAPQQTPPKIHTFTDAMRPRVLEGEQNRLDAFYGLAFRVNQLQDANKIAGYAFVMNGHDTCALLKYDPGVPQGYTLLRSQSNVPGILSLPDTNTLQVIEQKGLLTLKVNNQPVLINGAGQTQQNVNDTSTGGQLALLISGPNTSFTVTYVQLDIY